MTPTPETMSEYEQARWVELQEHWAKKANPRDRVPPRARAVFDASSSATKKCAAKAGQVLSRATPDRLMEIAGSAVDATLVPTVEGIVHLLELVNDWAIELSDPKPVLEYHREHGRVVDSLRDLRTLDLEVLDEFTRRMAARWRTIGAGEGAGLGALAMIPVPVLGSAAAITLDTLVMQVLTSAIATRICYAYGFDVADPAVHHMVDRMVARGYRNQTGKAGTLKSAGNAFKASKGRVNWSKKLREDHRLMAAVEKLLKQVGDGSRVPVKNARMGMPVIAVLAGAGTNAHVLGDTAKQARHYAATMHLATKYDLELPPNFA